MQTISETLNLLKNHRSVRKYKDQPIEQELLDQILEAGMRGSNTGNMQIYSIVVTRDAQRKKELAKFHFNQPMVANAAAVITVCLDINRWDKWCLQRNADPAYDNLLWLLTGSVDATIVSQNICVAAEAQGLGICYLGTVLYSAPEIAEFLKLPKGVVPITTITMGYTDETPAESDRLPLDSVVHYEQYRDYTPADINKAFAEKENLQLTKDLIKENGTENLAQIFTQKRYTKADNIAISEKLYKYLKDSGFLK